MKKRTKTSEKKRVLKEIKRRAAAGKPLNSGANRGDWLYAAAVLQFGSWGATIEAAGFDYAQIRAHPMAKDECVRQIRTLSAAGDLLMVTQHKKLVYAARGLFGGWHKAIKAAGCKLPERGKWTRETIIAAIREDLEKGLLLNAASVVARHEGLYQAGRRRFGSWASAFDAATVTGSKPKRTEISARAVRRLRSQMGIDHAAFGEQVGVSDKVVVNWESAGLSASTWGYIAVRQLLNENKSGS